MLKSAVGQVFVFSIARGAALGCIMLKLMGNNPKSMKRAVAPQVRANNDSFFIVELISSLSAGQVGESV